MQIAVQMDRIQGIDVQGDSTWMMILEALRRGFYVYYYHPDDLSWHTQHGISARMSRLSMSEQTLMGIPSLQDLQVDSAQQRDLRTMDAVLMRQDPPFDMHYLSATYILERLPSQVVVVNNPAEVRNAPEKIFVMDFADLMPPTVISSDKEVLKAFWQQHKDVIAKPLYGNGGAGIFHIRADDDNFDSLWEMHQAHYHTPMQLQKFLPKVTDGDKRILLIDGEPVGAIDRLPAKGQARANMHVGGTAIKAGLSTREIEICQQLAPKLRELGMIFVGIDVIDGLITEINVTSPTGIQEVNRFDQVQIEKTLWDAIVRHRNSRN